MALIQSLITSDKYSVKCPYSMNPIGVCVHNTYNDASAKNEISYMKSNNNQVSFHVAIDDVEAIQAIRFDRNAWHAGDGGSGTGNRRYIAVEICYSKSGGDRFIKAEKRAAKEIAAILKQFGWGISNVKKHQDFSGKYCPHRTLDMGWQRFLNMISAELNGTSVSSQPSKNTSSNTVGYTVKITASVLNVRKGPGTNYDVSTTVRKNEVYTIVEEKNGWGKLKSGAGWISLQYTSKGNTSSTQSNKVLTSKCDPVVLAPVTEVGGSGTATITASSIKFRDHYCTHCGVVQGTYNKGESVIYDKKCYTEKYVWISWISASTGKRRWMPIKDRRTGEVWATVR